MNAEELKKEFCEEYRALMGYPGQVTVRGEQYLTYLIMDRGEGSYLTVQGETKYLDAAEELADNMGMGEDTVRILRVAAPMPVAGPCYPTKSKEPTAVAGPARPLRKKGPTAWAL